MRALIATRKGLFAVERRRAGWATRGPHFLGANVVNAEPDPRDGAVWVSLAHGHWGPKLHVSRDDLATFRETACPAFADGRDSVRRVHTVVPAGPDGALHVGTDPGALFTSRDGGETWALDEALWARRRADRWFPSGGGLMLHSIEVAPDDPLRIHVGVSCGGVYETIDGGATWEPRNRGVRADHLPEPFPDVGQDPHRLRRHPGDPDVLWQQNHCGNYRSTDGGRSWHDVTGEDPRQLGYALALDDEDARAAWTVPLESDACRVAPGGRLAACRTDDGGSTWRRLTRGLPQEHCYDIVFRHALDAAAGAVVFGTTAGRVFASLDRGETWELAAPYLPPVNAVRIVR